MKGFVDEFGRALLSIRIRATEKSKPMEITAWIDTAFNGELVLPRQIIENANLEQSAGVEAKLADGSSVMLESYTCTLIWFKQEYPIETIANDGGFPLLGIGLLIGHRLTIDYTKQTVNIK